jgi:uncharacterized protein YkwD
VRVSPKLLLLALTILSLALAGTAAGPAGARPGDSSRHHSEPHRGSHRSAARQRPEVRKQARAKRRAAQEQARANRRAAREEARANRRAAREHTHAAPQKVERPPSAGATIAAVLATACQDIGLTPTGENLTRVRASVLCLINRVRAEHGLQPLNANAQLESAAQGHAAELVSDDYFAHVSPSGVTPVDRIKAAGYIPDPSAGYVIGENLAWGTYSLSTPQAIVEAWVASPGHLANILESRYTETGIGVTAAVPPSLAEGNPGATYAEEFGVIVH